MLSCELAEPLLKLQNVCLQTPIGTQTILRDVSFEVAPGDRIAVIGPLGAGKTSLLRLLNRLIDPHSGSLFLDGEDFRQIPVLQLRQQITLVLQESKLLGMTVRDAIAYPLTLRGSDRATIQQRTATWMEQLHIPSEWLDRTELELSVGQRQLVAIARALVIQPRILLLDEPTSALDAGRAAYLMQVLSRLPDLTQTAVIMVNHQLALAREFSSRVLYFQHGELLDDLPTHNLDWDGLEKRLVQAEAREAAEWE